jgi:hypothetical protein
VARVILWIGGGVLAVLVLLLLVGVFAEERAMRQGR